MPSVKDKKTGKTKSFPYTAKGKKAAASYKKAMVKSYSMTKGRKGMSKCGSKSKNSFKAGMSIGRNMKKKKK